MSDAILAWLYAAMSVVSLVLVLMVGILARMIRVVSVRRDRRRHMLSQAPVGTAFALDLALDSAAKQNPYSVSAPEISGIRLGQVARCVPDRFDTAVAEIASLYRAKRAISVDLGGIDDREALRIVDFCSGLASSSLGWIFRITDRVIIITPGPE